MIIIISSMVKRIQDINLEQLKEYSLQLAHKVGNKGWKPEHILYVERAGLFVGHVIANYFDCTISGICCGRIGSCFKPKLKIILKLLPRPVTHLLRRAEIKSNVHSIHKERRVYVEGHYPPNDKNLLIVDDAVDTGYSAKGILCFLLDSGYHKEKMKIAVLTNTYEDPACRADISLFDQVNFAFPWSYDSREYIQAWKLYDGYKSSII